MIYNKVLIISHLPLSEETNVGKTLYNLFSSYPEGKIMQLFFKNFGDTKACYDSFYIGDISKSSIDKKAHNSRNGGLGLLYPLFRFFDIRSPFLLLLRDLLWRFKNLEKLGLYKWVENGKPDYIFLAPGYSMFPYKIAVMLSAKFNIKLCTFFMEDFYNEKRLSFSPFFWLRYHLFRNTVQKCVKQSEKLFCLNEALNNEYKICFKRNLITLFNPAEITNETALAPDNFEHLVILYGGSISESRIDVLLSIGNAVNFLKQKGYDIVFNTYGPVQTDAVMQEISHCAGINYGGLLNYKELQEKIAESNCLVHVESFRPKYVAKTKMAFSTKIPEYLASGKLVWAVGPNGIESIDYLKRHKAAVITDSMDEIMTTLEDLLNNRINVQQLLNNAMDTLKNNHNKDTIQNILYNELCQK